MSINLLILYDKCCWIDFGFQRLIYWKGFKWGDKIFTCFQTAGKMKIDIENVFMSNMEENLSCCKTCSLTSFHFSFGVEKLKALKLRKIHELMRSSTIYFFNSNHFEQSSKITTINSSLIISEALDKSQFVFTNWVCRK